MPAVSGTYYLDVRAIAGSGPYTLESGVGRPRRRRRGRREGRVPERVRPAPARLGPGPPRRSLRPQRARDPDRREPQARPPAVRARMWPATLPATAFRLRSGSARASARAAPTGRLAPGARPGPATAGSSCASASARGRYRLRAELRASGYDAPGRATGTRYGAGSRGPLMEAELQEVGRSLHAALPARGRNPLRALDERAMELASGDQELRAALFRFVDVTPACRSLDDLARHLADYLEDVDDRPGAAGGRDAHVHQPGPGAPRSAPPPRPGCATWRTASSWERRRPPPCGRSGGCGSTAPRCPSTCWGRPP